MKVRQSVKSFLKTMSSFAVAKISTMLFDEGTYFFGFTFDVYVTIINYA